MKEYKFGEKSLSSQWAQGPSGFDLVAGDQCLAGIRALLRTQRCSQVPQWSEGAWMVAEKRAYFEAAEVADSLLPQ